jgi:predicted nucleic acid-binding protein
MMDGMASWCDMVAVELWNGARGDYEKRRLAELEKEIVCLETNREVWDHARVLARECRHAGHAVPSADLVIAACALHHKAQLEHCDIHIEKILKACASSKRRKA